MVVALECFGALNTWVVCKYCTADNALSFPIAGSFVLIPDVKGGLWKLRRHNGVMGIAGFAQ